MTEDILIQLQEAKKFVTECCAILLDSAENENAKQVYLLDNQTVISETMKFLASIKTMFTGMEDSLAPDSIEEKCLHLSISLTDKLTATLADFKTACAKINPDVKKEDTVVSVTEETIKSAVHTDKSTQKIVQDMNDLNQKAAVSQIQEFTHAIAIDNKFTYYKAVSVQDLNAYINEVMAANPGKTIQVFSITFTPMPLKKTVIYTV